MKKLFLGRYYQDDKVTLGMLDIEGVDHAPIFTLENPWKGNQANVSCIPEGIYKCIVHNGPRYQEVWEVTQVPGRSGILLHRGNYERDTKGCILPGFGVDVGVPDVMVLHSNRAMAYLRGLLGLNEFMLEIQE